LSSTRRVKKGPGRRPQSAKRRRFMELRARGWSILAAAREVGVSRTSGMNWSRGYKTYRNGRLVGFVPPLDRLAVREVSARYLSQEERIEIADLHRAGLSVRGIAQRIGRSPSTISRELRRNGRTDGGYRPFEAHRNAVARRARHHRRRLETNAMLRHLVGELLGQRWSPQQIARHLHARYPHDPGMRLCHESIYQAIYQRGSRLVRPAKVPSEHRSPLRTGRDHRRAQQKPAQRRPRFAQPMLSIHQRPFDPGDRAEPGHWEGDLIVGKDHGSAIGTLVERTTRMIRLLHLPQRDAQTLHGALTARMVDLPPSLLRSITWDQGTEMARHTDITATLRIPVYFCDSHAPWQRGSNENANGLLRQYFPKGTDLTVHRPGHLRAVENEINRRPRMVLADRAPADLFAALLASPDQPSLRR
jgi:IS30 family transposase